MSKVKPKRVSKRKLAWSSLVFVASYVVLIAFIFTILLLANGSEWQDYVTNSVPSILTLCFGVLILYCIVFFYFYYEDKSFFNRVSNAFLAFSVLTVSIIICYLFGRFVNMYLRPVAMLALLYIFLFNRREAMMLNFVFSMLLFIIDKYVGGAVSFDPENGPFFALLISFISGTFAVFMAGRVRTRAGLLLTGCAVAVPTAIVVLLLGLTRMAEEGGWIPVVASMGYSVLGCVISAVLAMALLPVFESAFNRLTFFRLRELTSTNAPILVRLRKEAPGTFNHSLIVAQLAESCAIAIGENSELARAAAYYHDVGKLKQPDCFTENQSGYNVHDELMPELSADIIRSHTQDGYELLKAARLPEDICNVAREHHGTLPIKYFYAKASKISGGDADITDYCYLGPTPRSKIAAIIMIADAAEAASRVVPNRTPENVERVVRGIIEERMDLDQFGMCNITMRELTVIKQTLVEALSGVHHHRVEYPSIRFNRAKQAVKEEAAQTDHEKHEK